MAKHRVAVDTGGTFSDFVFFNEDTGEISITKVPSTPKEPFQAVLNGVKELVDQGVAARDISFFCHGTTVGTNTLLEEKGAKTGLLVTQGFRGIYEVMEQTRGYGPATYDLFFEKPRLLAPPYLTEEIPERVDFRGNALKPIDVEASLQAVRNLKKKGVQSVAVCFLFSFLNPDHELKIKEIFAKEFPEASLSLSYEVLPQIREFYRMSTTVINAYIAPVMANYVSQSFTLCSPTAGFRHSKARPRGRWPRFSPVPRAVSSHPWAPANGSTSITSLPSTWAAPAATSH
jgi:N-methylhydantoinase A